jgi:hypothetical protein
LKPSQPPLMCWVFCSMMKRHQEICSMKYPHLYIKLGMVSEGGFTIERKRTMKVPQRSGIAPASSAAREPGRRWRMDWFVGARWAWIVAVLLLAGNFVASIPAYYTILRTMCTLPAAQCGWQPTPANVMALARLHLPVEAYAAYFVSLDVAASLLFWIVGILIFWRKSQEWMGLLFSLVLILNGASGIADTLQGTFLPLNAHAPFLLGFLLLLLNLIQWPALGTFLVTFPTGRFAPRWSWVIVLLWLIQLGFFRLTSIIPFLLHLILVVVLVTYGSTFGIQVYRYVRVYDAVERQQVKWCIYAFFAGLAVEIGSGVLGGLVAPLKAPDSWYQLLNGTFTVLLFVPIPLAIGIAIFRYHLWDIDIIINRTLVYGLLSAMLALVCFGLVIGLQSLVRLVTGTISEQPLTIVASTLAIAALFQPLRRRIQRIIDRRFYRRKYDAARTLAAFSATLRNEVDLDQLREELVVVVQETMQPTHVSLWLCKPDRMESASPAYE